jgi:hypothetical protein
MPDGGALIEALAGMEAMSAEELIPFDANLAEFLEDDTLGEIASDLVGAYEDDLASRQDWEETYVPKAWISWAFSPKSAALRLRAHRA